MNKKIFLIGVVAAFTACNEWLDVQPKDKMLEKQQFSTEENMYSAANGLYRELTGEHLYGGQLTQTTIEVMGHFYTYPPSQPASGDRSRPFYLLANFIYTDDDVKGRFADIWKNAYSTLLHINVFIKNVEESNIAISERNKRILLGEAYGLRAYLHFDIFRLFGPVYQDRTDEKALPYNHKTEVVPNHSGYEETEYSTAGEYIARLLKDVAKADSLLDGNDPVQTEANCITEQLLSDHFFQNRNRRMNYYAVKALEARIRQYIGDGDQAAAAAKVVTDQAGKVFNWVNVTSFATDYNYQFFSEVIFGINNPDRYSRAIKWYEGADIRDVYVADYNNLLSNILAYAGSSLSAIPDIRSKQWKVSNVAINPGYSRDGTYKSNRYIKVVDEKKTAYNDFQPLIRLPEMYYIQAETALKNNNIPEVVDLLNQVLQHRGLTQQYYLTASKTEAEIRAHIEREYYREYFGEGQAFFFHKRLKSAQMFKGDGSGYTTVNAEGGAYVVPIPQDETDI
jgi:hypothetical protein